MAEGMNLDDITKKLMEYQKDTMPQLKAIIERQNLLSRPKSSKNITIDDKNVIASLTQDAKIYISFATTEDADAFYAKFDGMHKDLTFKDKLKKLFKIK